MSYLPFAKPNAEALRQNRAFFTPDKRARKKRDREASAKGRILCIVVASFTVWRGRVYQDYLWVTELIG